ncbi:alpha/beta hydrolase [Castellaniella caeni]|uniref:alpha/beta hydrolase n=1 Tax=Castellaniella caeni TaxID=266123 RepID=UPI000829A18E|nr:alpha/beta hydrolase [Castellaniella caeni]
MTIASDLTVFLAGLQQAWPEPPINLGVAAWRARAEQLARESKAPYPVGMAVIDACVQQGQRTVAARVYTPRAEVGGARPCLLYMHGGGWVVGSHETHDAITAEIAERTGMVVISVHYARAPENPYPAAVEDCRAVFEWIFKSCDSLSVDPARVFVGGDSAGGNLATVLALAYRADAGHPIRGQVLIYPCVDADFSRASYRTEAEAPFLTTAEMIWFWDQYCPIVDQRTNPEVAPLRATDLSGLPPALIMVAEHDPLHDEGVLYARALEKAGNAVCLRPGKGLVHGYLRARSSSMTAAAEFLAMCDWLEAQGAR